MAHTEERESPSVDVDTGVLRRGRVLVQRGQGAIFFMGFGSPAGRLDQSVISIALAKAGYRPDQSRKPVRQSGGGRWASVNEKNRTRTYDGFESAAARLDPTQAKKERFVDAHLADAQKAANQLSVPVENILGVSALESGWDTSRIAAEANNYFGLHFGAPFSVGFIRAKEMGSRSPNLAVTLTA